MKGAFGSLKKTNAKLTSGKIGPDQWADEFHDNLLAGHLNALELGAKRSGSKEWTKEGAPKKGYYSIDDWEDGNGTWHQGIRSIARGIADTETQYLHGYTDQNGGDHRGFLNDLKEKDPRYWDEEIGDWREGSLDGRSDLYVGKMRGSANQAFADFSPEDTTLTWELGPLEHCDDCLSYASILVDRAPDEFFAYPGNGDSVCLGNCGCDVVRSDGARGFSNHNATETEDIEK